ncbi:uncharacterized protein SPSC_01126 [Sporisorium scitamineum]|uniref:Uncharacterized protein n=1 Tax=Sporisorium scitamineum TaxID=49012 RepID=A0A127Z8T8_9BASI|nr:uncharacterized protein SPSC_01126 [Sporisorium scitamineum]
MSKGQVCNNAPESMHSLRTVRHYAKGLVSKVACDKTASELQPWPSQAPGPHFPTSLLQHAHILAQLAECQAVGCASTLQRDPNPPSNNRPTCRLERFCKITVTVSSWTEADGKTVTVSYWRWSGLGDGRRRPTCNDRLDPAVLALHIRRALSLKIDPVGWQKKLSLQVTVRKPSRGGICYLFFALLRSLVISHISAAKLQSDVGLDCIGSLPRCALPGSGPTLLVMRCASEKHSWELGRKGSGQRLRTSQARRADLKQCSRSFTSTRVPMCNHRMEHNA